METIDIETEIDTCDECGRKMIVFKSAMPRYGRSGLGLCTDCTDSPITIEPPPNAEYPHTIIGIAVYKAPVVPTVRKFEITVNTATSVITIFHKKENVKMHKPYLWSANIMIGWDAFVINSVLYVPVLKEKAIVLNHKILEEM